MPEPTVATPAQPTPPAWPYGSGHAGRLRADEPRNPKTNGFAIASMGFGIVGVLPLSIAFGITALVQIGKRNQAGRRLAIGGLVVSAAWIAVVGLVIAFIAADRAERDATGQIAEEGWVETTSLQVGDCLNDLDDSSAVATLPALPCSDPHEGEVFGSFDLSEGAYPGEATVLQEADLRCGDLLREYSTTAFDDSAIGLSYLYPTERSWPSDRKVVCIAVSLDGPLSKSLADHRILGA